MAIETNKTNYNFRAVRLKVETIALLRDMKDAFESSYGEKFTMDQFVTKLVLNVKDGDPDIWDIYEIKKRMKNELAQKIEASKRRRRMAEVVSEENSEEREEAD